MPNEVPEIDDVRCRLIVELPAAPSRELRAMLATCAAADRLAGIVGGGELAELAMALPTALLAPSAEADPAVGVAGALVAAEAEPAAAMAAARHRWGDAAILLANVGTSRHAAMEAGEAGADALLFTGALEPVGHCVRWWSELFVLPAAAAAPPLDLAILVEAGADFLLVDGRRLVAGGPPAGGALAAIDAAEARRPSPFPPPGPER